MGNDLIFYGWILDGKTRKVVWNLLDEYESEFFRGEGEFSFDANIKLKKGSYEVYFTGIYGNARRVLWLRSVLVHIAGSGTVW